MDSLPKLLTCKLKRISGVVVVGIWLVCFCKVQFRTESCVSFQLKGESTKDEVAFTDCSGIAVE